MIFVQFIIKTIALGIVVKLVPGIRIRDFGSLLVTVILLGIANAVLRPILVFFSFPLILITFGLFLIVINAAILKILDAVMGDNFTIDGWTPAFVGTILLSIVSWIIERLFVAVF